MDAFTPRTREQWQGIVDRQFPGWSFVRRGYASSGLWIELTIARGIDQRVVTVYF